jgi:serine/threonine protein kinase
MNRPKESTDGPDGDETQCTRKLPVRIGNYAITGLLGEGSFAAVYSARDFSTGRTVALKVPHDQKDCGRIRLEANMADMLRNVPRVPKLLHCDQDRSRGSPM